MDLSIWLTVLEKAGFPGLSLLILYLILRKQMERSDEAISALQQNMFAGLSDLKKVVADINVYVQEVRELTQSVQLLVGASSQMMEILKEKIVGTTETIIYTSTSNEKRNSSEPPDDPWSDFENKSND